MHDDVGVTNDHRRKPNVHVMYDHTKGGVDVVDLLSSSHSTRIKTKRWPLNALAFILDTCRTNAKTILGDNMIKFTNFEFTYELGKSLVVPNIERRYCDSNGLQIKILNKMRRILGIEIVNYRTPTGNIKGKSGRCYKCVEAIVGNADYKKKREKLNNKHYSKCCKCSQFLCNGHKKEIQCMCETCFDV